MFQSNAREGAEMPFLDHLEELRWRLIRCLAAVLVFTVIGFVVVMELNVLGLLIAPVEPFLDGTRLKYLNPVDPFFITLKLGLVLGLVLASPVLIWQTWAFFSPALNAGERRVVVPALYLGLLLFCAGVAMAYWVVLPVTLNFMMGFQTEALEQAITAPEYLSLVVRLLLAFGLVFELPVVILILSALGFVTAEWLAGKRRHAVVAITVVASVITPGDVITITLLMMVPLILLYEFSILLARIFGRPRRAAPAVEGA